MLTLASAYCGVTPVALATWRRDVRLRRLPGYRQGTVRVLYSRGGCSREIQREPGVRCFSAADLYR
jgi:hypothetical protein